ncbi:M16 family metallopeptidase [Deinococcus radiodurans]|jgi:Predicted Zn-dependent peptidases|nr:pitrilysin family protein [Deinococcus radiodurans]ANC71288.1 protease [Deinococcus radiodurans R1 = ATCC 13939 = DSM 20539]QIP29587.1 insulinase family protein [Deinococcus radiodurans]QIP31725.1 insulinase family protein [Deinococcus radiodurans]UID70573.1 protease [Deinococcus radiodurans R1 = ATCC 13939 = DSM 20539]
MRFPAPLFLTALLLLGVPAAAQTVSAQPATAQTPATQTPAAPAAASAQPTLPAGVRFVTEVEGIREYRLGNGLRVLLFPDTSQTTFTLNTTYLVGSRHENYGETGMAHLLEHMLFKGTPTSGNLMEQLSKRGASFNGTTSDDRTNYFETMTNSGDNLEWAIRMEADRMVNSRVSADDLKTEMTVVRNEFESGENNPFGLLYKQVRSVAFDWHNYGNTAIGNRSDVENVPIGNLKAFYKTYYQPDNAVVTLAGNFDEGQALTLIADSYGKVRRPWRTLPRQYTEENPQDGERSLTVRRVGDAQYLIVGYHIPSVRHPDAAALQVLGELLSDEPSGRLYQALVQTGQATAAGSITNPGSDPGLATYVAILGKDDDLQKAQATLLSTLENAAKTPFTEEEVARVRTRVLSGYEQALTKPEAVGVGLSEAIAAGDWRLFFQGRDAIEKVTPADVQRVAATYLKSTNRTLGAFIPTAQPDRVAVPAAPSAADVLRDFKGRAAQSAGETIAPEPDALEARVLRETVAGAKVAMLPKKTRGERIELVLSLDFGNPETVRTGSDAADFVGPLLTRGSRSLTRQQLHDRLEAAKSQLDVSAGASGATLTLSTDRQHLPEALGLLRQVLREPVFPQADFDELKKAALDGTEAGRGDPESVAGLALGRAFMPADAKRGDLAYVPTLDESLQDTRAVTLAQVRDYYAKVWNGANAQLGVVGDFDPQTIREALPTLLGGFDSAVKYERVKLPLTTPAAQDLVLNVPDKANAIYIAQLNFPLRDDHPDAAALDVAMRIFGGGTDSRLFARLRQQDGLSYTVGGGAHTSSLDEKGSFTTYAIFNPVNSEKVAAGMREELARALKEGFSAQEVATAQSALLQELRVGRSDDASLAGALASQAYLGRTYAFSKQYEERVKAVTPQAAAAALRKYVNPANLVIVRAGTFK